MEKYQRSSVERLCIPRGTVDTFQDVMSKSPKGSGLLSRPNFLINSNRDLGTMKMTPHVNNALMKSGGLQIDDVLNSPTAKRNREIQRSGMLSPSVRHLKSTLLKKKNALSTIKNSSEDTHENDLKRTIDNVMARRNTMDVNC